MQHVAVILIGMAVGLVSGLFGKGGSAIATPLLQLAGVPAFVAVAAPLPATIPSTLAASLPYFRAHLYNRKALVWSIVIGMPAAAIGAWLSQFVGGRALLLISDALIVILGLSLFVRTAQPSTTQPSDSVSAARVCGLAGFVGIVSGLLANSGGVLLAPLYIRLLKLPVHVAFACSLVVSAALAIPGTAVHAWLGHIDWPVVAEFAAGSVPLAYLGARTSLKMKPARLEKLLGMMLVTVGLAGLIGIYRA